MANHADSTAGTSREVTPRRAPSARRTIAILAGIAAGVAGLVIVGRAASSRASGASGGPAPRAAPAGGGASATEAKVESRAALRELGRAILFDESLSEPPGTSCVSCHDPSRGYAGNHGSKVGVAAGSRPDLLARRSTPSLHYLRFVHPFHFHWEEDAPLPDGVGGFFWDGRASTIAAVVPQPLLNASEMGNHDAREVAAKVALAPYAERLRAEIPDALSTPEATMSALGVAVEAFLLSPEMSPFTSKYDDVIRGHAELSPLESEGLAVFKDPERGACDDCHRMDDRSKLPERSLFTDYGFEAVGAPRNRRLPATRDPRYVDLGLCERHDDPTHTDDERLCGSFRTPSLRNVATRPSFMHNGTFTKLRDVVSFYATRTSDPRRWYPQGDVFDDVPPAYKEYVNVRSAPYSRTDGKPALTEHEIDAIVAFLQTLTDAAYR